MTQRLFVYGTLVPGGPNHHLLEGLGGCWAAGSVRGRLYPLGWGATMGYPAIVLDPKAEPVPGHVLTSPDLERHWRRLDEFEGEGYERVRADVELADGTVVEAYLYAVRG